MEENIKKFIQQFKSDQNNLDVNPYINYYKGLNVTTSLGIGTLAYVPFIAFLGGTEKTQDGIYPVILFYRNRNIVVLAYGISANNKPKKNWGVNDKSISDLFIELNLEKLKKSETNYLNSLVYRYYEIDSLDTAVLVQDLNVLIDEYKQTLLKFGVSGDTPFVQPPRTKGGKNLIFNIAKAIRFNVPDMKDANNNAHNESKNNNEKADTQVPFNMSALIEAIKQTGLMYEDNLLQRYACSLITKPFVILSGLAGSGKTQLALAFARAMSEDVEQQLCVIPVGADWTNREPLLGYPNALKQGEYTQPESGALQIMMRALRNPRKPYFLVLDEMNLSYVERYFADFLSALESHQEIALWEKPDECDSEVPAKIALPKNLFIVGTINVDETTYMFSPKVLDRASVIEFKISDNEMERFLGQNMNINVHVADGTCANMGQNFVELSTPKDTDKSTLAQKTLIEFFRELKKVNAEFGYRSATEIYRFIANAKNCTQGIEEDEILDAAIVQKLLPKLHGSRKKIVPVLKALWLLCGTEKDIEEFEGTITVPDSTKYKLTADKILRMYQGAIDNGFTSFAEA